MRKPIFILLLYVIFLHSGNIAFAWTEMSEKEKARILIDFLTFQYIGCMDASIAITKDMSDQERKESTQMLILATCPYESDLSSFDDESYKKLSRMSKMLDMTYSNPAYEGLSRSFVIRAAAKVVYKGNSLKQYEEDLELLKQWREEKQKASSKVNPKLEPKEFSSTPKLPKIANKKEYDARSIKWKMSMEQVSKQEKRPVSYKRIFPVGDESIIEYDNIFLEDYATTLTYTFFSDKCYSVTYQFKENNLQIFIDISAILESKFGKPAESDYERTWNTPTTIIKLSRGSSWNHDWPLELAFIDANAAWK